jgi:predicted methyltransferase
MSTKSRSIWVCSLWVLQELASAAATAKVPVDIAQAIADPKRPPAQVELDQWRRPAAVIEFAGIKRGDKVADFMSGGGYFTRLFSAIVGPQGRVYAFLPTQELENCAPEETAGTKALEADARYANVHVVVAASERFSAPEALDMVWTSQNYHDLHDKFLAPTDTAVVDAAIFRALKPGGVFMVIDHIAERGSGLRDTETLHRIDPETIRSEVTAAGFVLEARSDLLKNPHDSHVLPVFDAAIRHRTDQVILKFRKPLVPVR